jgi:hypothetical protein
MTELQEELLACAAEVSETPQLSWNALVAKLSNADFRGCRGDWQTFIPETVRHRWALLPTECKITAYCVGESAASTFAWLDDFT